MKSQRWGVELRPARRVIARGHVHVVCRHRDRDSNWPLAYNYPSRLKSVALRAALVGRTAAPVSFGGRVPVAPYSASLLGRDR